MNWREKCDMNEMKENAPNAHPTLVDDALVWFEYTDQGGRTYYLAYWYDSEQGDYQAAIIEGASYNGNTIKDHIYSDNRLCLKGDSDPKFKSAFEVRNRAILWACLYSEYLKTGIWEVPTI
ncbi:MAG: hypothetical protein Q3M24_19910 [Candidatus Electrothrix aestuarii]|uniref:Type II CBASS E2 protein domain-containing protein n=1 Tax=Candidatus Electrothrix aestuarii TaxID=3062594 RepID=A0AAU8LTD2_9BACT|nr:hypothetical protein [Candidatus Electrothrix aestuarii]